MSDERDKPVTEGEELALMACLVGVQPESVRQYGYVIQAVVDGREVTVVSSRCAHHMCTQEILGRGVALEELARQEEEGWGH
jgi:hypothetical protein